MRSVSIKYFCFYYFFNNILLYIYTNIATYMKTPKVIYALLLLLLSSNVFSFSTTNLTTPESVEATSNSVLTESVGDLYESTLILSFTIQNNFPTADPVLHSFQFSSAYKSTTGNKYVKHSKYIHPGLEVPDIIFPFHIFL